MAEQSARALEVRIGKDQKGFGQNRQGKAYTGQNSRRARPAQSSVARGQAQPLETQNQRRMGEKAVTWEIRCPDLLHVTWQRFSGPSDAWKAARIYAENLDHDEARPIGWGKKVVIEMRQHGRGPIQRFEVTGEAHYRYHAKELG